MEDVVIQLSAIGGDRVGRAVAREVEHMLPRVVGVEPVAARAHEERNGRFARSDRSREATVPFFMSTRGYGFYSNNTWKHVFDFTGNGPSYSVTSEGGQLDTTSSMVRRSAR